MKYGAFRPRRPPLPRRPGFYTMARRGYPTNPLQPIPLVGSGNFVDHRPYPSREHPALPIADIPPVGCPPGMAWSVLNRRCVALQPTAQMKGLAGYGGYLSPEIKERFEWDSLGVGLGAMAATMTLGIATSLIIQGSHKKGREPKVDMSLLPSLIPGIGAGIIAYLLRWNMNNCPCDEETAEIRAIRPDTVLESRAATPCPPGMAMTPRGCEEVI